MENEVLVLDLLEWVESRPRSYEDVMNAWRTSCPRLMIWEDTTTAKLVRRQGKTVQVTSKGLEFLQAHGRHSVVR